MNYEINKLATLMAALQKESPSIARLKDKD